MVAAAFLTRPQYGILYVTWVAGLGVLWLIAPWSRPRTRRDLVGLWPTALPVVLGVLAFAAKLASGSSASDSLGAYWELWRGYDPLQVAKWFVYHLGDFAVYPAIVSGLLVVAAFTSTPWGYDRLHDRYGFYLVPLWLIGLVVWLASGLPRPLLAAAIGAVAALALALILPFHQLANEAGVGPACAGAVRRGAARRDILLAAQSRAGRAPRGRGGDVRRDVVLRVGAD